MSQTSLQGFVEQAGKGSHLRVEHDFGGGFVRLRTSEAERRQAAQDIQCSENILLELLRNSKDAHASHVFVAVSKEGAKRIITVIDDGDGVPRAMHLHVFEPRVTSKLDSSHMDAWGLHGRGMALYSISQNTQVARIVESEAGLGCVLHVESDTARLPERTDQSTFPAFIMDTDDNVNIRGPRNLLRTACEFAIQSRSACAVYMGSPAEIASTMFAYGTSTLSDIDRIFCKDTKKLPVTKRLATAADPADLARLCQDMGLEISERSARRIMDGQIPVKDQLLDMIRIDNAKKAKSQSQVKRPTARLKLDKQDIAALKQALCDSFADIAEKYYLDSRVEPSVLVHPERLVVSLPLVGKDD